MGRLILVIIVMAISGIVYLVKAGASKVTGNENVNFRDESQKIMQKTARGVKWMNEQWEDAKNNVSGNARLESGNEMKNLSATEIIARIKANAEDQEIAKMQYIEIAVYKMENRQFDDAEKLIRQLPGGEARDYMLEEVNQKRNS